MGVFANIAVCPLKGKAMSFFISVIYHTVILSEITPKHIETEYHY